ncbi:MAG: hypothetical protein ACR2NL_05630 [Acidimicrobiia bacterium]
MSSAQLPPLHAGMPLPPSAPGAFTENIKGPPPQTLSDRIHRLCEVIETARTLVGPIEHAFGISTTPMPATDAAEGYVQQVTVLIYEVEAIRDRLEELGKHL